MRFLRRTSHASVALLLWAGLLLFGQTVALAHQHSDDLPDTTCAVCSLTKAEMAACDVPPAVAPPTTAFAPTRDGHGPGISAVPARPYQSRAPPPA